VIDLPLATLGAAALESRLLSRALVEEFDATGVNIFQNNGIDANQHVPHYHLYVVPRLTALQQKYLRAMAQLGPGPYKTGDIAATLGVRAAAIATIRQQLIDKGMVWSQRHGETAFTVPMFDVFTKRQIPVFERHKPKRRILK